MTERLKEYQQRHEAFLKTTADHLMRVINKAYHGTPFVAAPGASLWTRLKVKWWNWKMMRAYRAQQATSQTEKADEEEK